MENAYPRDGAATTRTIAVTIQTKWDALASSAKTTLSNVTLVIASPPTIDVTVRGIVEICRTKKIVLPNILVEGIVQSLNSNATTTCVSVKAIFATEQMTVEIAQMSHLRFAATSAAMSSGDSSVTTGNVYQGKLIK